MRLSLSCLLLLGACQRTPEPLWAQAGARHLGEDTIAGAPLDVPRCVAAAPTIDGRLDDDCWRNAAVAGPLVQPGNGAAAAGDDPVAGFARLTWDARALYCGLVVRDRAPVSPFSRDAVDPHIWGAASGIEIMIQPGDPGDNRDYYELQVDVAGAVWDTRFDDYNQPVTGAGAQKTFGHQEWDARLERAIHVEPKAFYAVEAALPWSSFAKTRVAVPPAPGDVWRVNLYTFRDGQRRALAWSPLRGQGNFHKSSRFGRVKWQ